MECLKGKGNGKRHKGWKLHGMFERQTSNLTIVEGLGWN